MIFATLGISNTCTNFSKTNSGLKKVMSENVSELKVIKIFPAF